MKILCVGEAMIELLPSADGKSATVGVAGDVLNTAIYLRRGLSASHTVAFASALGSDPFSGRIINFAREHGINCHAVGKVAERAAGLYSVSVDAAGERSFTYWRSMSAARVMFGPDDRLDYSILDGADVVFLSAITLAILSPAARDQLLLELAHRRKSGLRVAFDSNYRPRLWESQSVACQIVGRAWAITDLGFPSLDDELALFAESAKATTARLSGYGMSLCVLKRGQRGPHILSPSGTALDETFAPAPLSLDTTGAGDSFNGTFLAHYLMAPGDIVGAAHAAHDMACRVIGVRGAILP